MYYKCKLSFTAVLFWVASIANAQGLGAEFNGFATLTVSYSDDPDMGFASYYLNTSESGLSLTRDAMVGGQANITLTEQWDAVIQGVYQNHSYKSPDNFLELAFLRFRPQRHWVIRAGRLNRDLYLLSEYPYVGYAYLWVRPPHEFYSFVSSASRVDGADIEYNQSVYDGFLRVKLSYGKSDVKATMNDDKFFVSFDKVLTLSTVYTNNEWTYRFSTSNGNTDSFNAPSLSQLLNAYRLVPTEVWPQASSIAASLDTKGHKVQYTAAGITYDNEDWMIQSEIGISDSAWQIAPSNLSGYLSVARRFGDKTFYAAISATENRKDIFNLGPPLFPPGTPAETAVPILQLAEMTQRFMQTLSVHQHSFSLGAKWYISDHLVFKGQIDHFQIQPYGGGLWKMSSNDDLKSKQRVNLFSLSSSVVF